MVLTGGLIMLLLNCVLYAIFFLSLLGIIETLGCADQITGDAADTIEFNGNPPKTLACLIFTYAVKLCLCHRAATLTLDLLDFGTNEALGQVIGIDNFSIHCKSILS